MGADEEAGPPRIPPEATAADPPLAPGLGVSQEAHLSVPGEFLTKQDSHFHCPGLLNMDMSNPFVVAPPVEAPVEVDAVGPGPAPPLLTPTLDPLASATARGAICSAALLPAPTPPLILRAFRGLVENSKWPGASLAMWSSGSSAWS